MKKLNKFITALMIAGTALTGCSKEGKDGDIYLAIRDYGIVTGYTDNNNSIPYGFYFGVDYGPCKAGTYDFAYSTEYYSNGSWHSGTWTGTYSIWSNPGKDAKFLSEGEVGEDKYFVFNLYNGGYITRPGQQPDTMGLNLQLVRDTAAFVRTVNAGNFTIKVEGHFTKSAGKPVKLAAKKVK